MLATLNQQLEEFHREERLQNDPLVLLDRSLGPRDLELVSFIVAGLSYGRVEQIQKSAKAFFVRLTACGVGPTGEALAQEILRDDFVDRAAHSLRGWKHRMNTARDMTDLLFILREGLLQSGSLRQHMARFRELPADQRIAAFCESLAGKAPRSRTSKTKGWAGTGASWFLSSPRDGSSCKRLFMWLRWMVRKNEVDPGIWQLFPGELPLKQSELFVPLDAHVFRWARQNGVTKLKTPNWKAVQEVTSYFRTLCPEDPLKYDFAIFQNSYEEFRSKLKRKPDGML